MKIQIDEEIQQEDWALTYGDMVSLLLCFFILLFSMSTLDPKKFEEATASITEQISGEKPVMPIQEVIDRLKRAVQKRHLEQDVHVSSDGVGVVIEFSSSLLFELAKAEINPVGANVLAEMGRIIGDPDYVNYGIEVEGHTDDIPITNVQFPSNWELSSSRASSVIRLMHDQKIDPKRLRSIGYADTQPKVPNRNPDGTPIPANQSENRRILIRLYPSTYDKMTEAQKGAVQAVPTSTTPTPQKPAVSTPAPEVAPVSDPSAPAPSEPAQPQQIQPSDAPQVSPGKNKVPPTSP